MLGREIPILYFGREIKKRLECKSRGCIVRHKVVFMTWRHQSVPGRENFTMVSR
jgi:hypothetical protein